MSQTADAESEAGSICDEERIRKLFQACDGDGDGFIDRRLSATDHCWKSLCNLPNISILEDYPPGLTLSSGHCAWKQLKLEGTSPEASTQASTVVRWSVGSILQKVTTGDHGPTTGWTSFASDTRPWHSWSRKASFENSGSRKTPLSIKPARKDLWIAANQGLAKRTAEDETGAGSQDLLTVCRELNLENSVEELMRELGADEHGRISYQEFLRCRLALRPEIEALRSGKHRSSPHHTHTPEYLPTSSDNSLGKLLFLRFVSALRQNGPTSLANRFCSTTSTAVNFSTDDAVFRLCSGTVSGRHERWEFDSGARDLSPEPHTLQKLVEAAAGGTGNMLDLANKCITTPKKRESKSKRLASCTRGGETARPEAKQPEVRTLPAKKGISLSLHGEPMEYG
ncbi:hypothetical protein WN48_03249 [Eufriesea mexicana]|nr:hypothetical protein WN48_03249 [Eufriesea mexicana]